jgi:hypothetical protein
MNLFKKDWRQHPQYLADFSGLFGGPPRLECRGCKKTTYELFYGHCKPCAKSHNIPLKTAEPQAFHDAMQSGAPAVIKGIPAQWHPWWHWRRWFRGKND